jgi:hypothetical protein
MGIEHRWSTRREVCLDAIVLHRPLGLFQVKILDLAVEGAFIAVAHLELPVPATVELTFALDIGSRQTIYQIDALTIHRIGNGYGLMFKNFRLDSFQSLKDILYAA